MAGYQDRRRARLGVRAGVIAVGSAAALSATAFGYVGGVGNGDFPSTNAPDLRSVTVTKTTPPQADDTPEARFCFDVTVNNVPNPGQLFIQQYDANLFVAAIAGVVDPTDETCVVASFPAGTDLTQGSSGTIGDNSVRNAAGTPAPNASVPLSGSAIAPAAGSTTAPDLVSATVNQATKRITYTFDENVDPRIQPAVADPPTPADPDPADFGFYVDSDNGAAPKLGTAITGITNNTVTVEFASVVNAKQFFVRQGAVADRLYAGAPAGTARRATRGSFGPTILGSPSLINAGKVDGTSGRIVRLQFSQSVVPANADAVVAYREDGSTVAGTYTIGTAGAAQDTIEVTLPPAASQDPNSVVRIGVGAGLVRATSGDNVNTIGAASLGTANITPGYTSGPDLLRTTVDDANNRATFVFDEPVFEIQAPTLFRLLNGDGTTQDGTAGTAVVNDDKVSVSVRFSGSASAAVGVSLRYGAVIDEIGEVSPEGSVSTALINPQPGTSPPPPPVATPTPVPATISRKATLSIKRKSGGKRYTGKVKTLTPCKGNRKVRLYRGSKRIKTVRTKKSGSYTIKLKKRPGGKVRARVLTKTVTKGVQKYSCKSDRSKQVRG